MWQDQPEGRAGGACRFSRFGEIVLFLAHIPIYVLKSENLSVLHLFSNAQSGVCVMSERTGARPKFDSPGERYYGTKEVRRMFGNVEPRTLTRWMGNPNVNFPKALWIGGQRFFNADEIDAFIKKCAAESLSGRA